MTGSNVSIIILFLLFCQHFGDVFVVVGSYVCVRNPHVEDFWMSMLPESMDSYIPSLSSDWGFFVVILCCSVISLIVVDHWWCSL